MMRKHFDEQLLELNQKLIEMGKLIETAIANGVKAMTERDAALARSTIREDEEIDRTEKDIEDLCLKLLLQQQPVARDLRLISSALKMITDMERIGDHAADISEIAVMIIERKEHPLILHIPQMAEATIRMVNDSIEAFVKKDLDMAARVIDADDKVDHLFEQIKTEIESLIREDTENSENAIDLIMIAKYFERIGDHATNIAEWVIFSITGEHDYGV